MIGRGHFQIDLDYHKADNTSSGNVQTENQTLRKGTCCGFPWDWRLTTTGTSLCSCKSGSSWRTPGTSVHSEAEEPRVCSLFITATENKVHSLSKHMCERVASSAFSFHPTWSPLHSASHTKSKYPPLSCQTHVSILSGNTLTDTPGPMFFQYIFIITQNSKFENQHQLPFCMISQRGI